MKDEATLKSLTFTYTNHAGVTSRRRVRPLRVWFGPSQWHEGDHWQMDAHDLDRKATRTFLVAGMGEIREE